MAMDGASASNTLKSGDVMFTIEGKDEWHWPGVPSMNSLHRARLLEELIKPVHEGVVSFNKQLVDVEMLGESEGAGVKLVIAS